MLAACGHQWDAVESACCAMVLKLLPNAASIYAALLQLRDVVKALHERLGDRISMAKEILRDLKRS